MYTKLADLGNYADFGYVWADFFIKVMTDTKIG